MRLKNMGSKRNPVLFSILQDSKETRFFFLFVNETIWMMSQVREAKNKHNVAFLYPTILESSSWTGLVANIFLW